MKMFNLIDIGERSGSGIPTIIKAWKEQNWSKPEILERFENLDRTTLLLSLKKVPIKSADKKVPIKSADKTTSLKSSTHKETIIIYAKGVSEFKSSDIAQLIDVGDTRAKVLLRELVTDGKLLATGSNRNRAYKLKK